MSERTDSTDPGLTYAGYLRLDELLNLQSPRSEEHDEMLFIVIHQTYELWFKETMHELRGAAAALATADASRAAHRLGRVRHILKIAVAQVDTPLCCASGTYDLRRAVWPTPVPGNEAVQIPTVR